MEFDHAARPKISEPAFRPEPRGRYAQRTPGGRRRRSASWRRQRRPSVPDSGKLRKLRASRFTTKLKKLRTSRIPRDRFIGWTAEQRQRNLHLVINNARFLILPWIECKNLASRLLSMATRRVPQDWHSRYGYSPVLLETFVETSRFQGTCYKATNWIRVGQTKGRGKLDIHHRAQLPIKSIWLYPLVKNFRRKLCK